MLVLLLRVYVVKGGKVVSVQVKGIFTFLRTIQSIFNDRIYKVTKIVDQSVEDDPFMLGPIVFWRIE